MKVGAVVGLSLHMHATLCQHLVMFTAARTMRVVRSYLSNNQLSGSFPASLGNLTNLQYLYVHSQTPHTDEHGSESHYVKFSAVVGALGTHDQPSLHTLSTSGDRN